MKLFPKKHIFVASWMVQILNSTGNEVGTWGAGRKCTAASFTLISHSNHWKFSSAGQTYSELFISDAANMGVTFHSAYVDIMLCNENLPVTIFRFIFIYWDQLRGILLFIVVENNVYPRGKRISQNKCLHRRFKYESIHTIHLLYKMLRTVTAGAVTILSASCQRMCIYFCSACHYCWIIFVKTNENKLHMP